MKSEFNYMITICFVVAAIFLLNIPVLVTAQDQSPPSGMDKGVWVLKEKKPDFKPTEDEPLYFNNHVSVSGNTVNGGWSWKDDPVKPECSGKVWGTCSWEELPSVIEPGVRQNTTLTADVGGSQSCAYRHVSARTELAINDQNLNEIYARTSYATSDPKPAPVSVKVPWEAPWGKIGDTLTITVIAQTPGAVSNHFYYNYIYTYEAPGSQPKQNTPMTRSEPVEQKKPAISAETKRTLELDDKIRQVLNIYQKRVPKGIVDSGKANNLLSWHPIRGKDYEPYTCGGYQSTVLELLDGLKFSKDPNERALLDNWDYGPIEVQGGSHHAVVIYPKGTDWVKTGIILDPWITQKPEAYLIKDWRDYFPDYWGPVGDSYYKESHPNYPILGGKYKDPKDRGIKPEYLERMKKGCRVMGNCPLNMRLIDEAGRVSGYSGDQRDDEIPEALVLRAPLSDGTYWTEMGYPMDGSYKLVMEGLDKGDATIFIGFGMDGYDQRSIYQYKIEVIPGRIYELDLRTEGSPIVSDLNRIEAEKIREMDISMLNSLPDLASIPAIEIEGQEDTDGIKEIPAGTVIFDNWNKGAVDNSPSCAPSFTLSEPHMITYIDTYHWNYGSGTNAGGTVILRDHDGKEYGPWQVETKSGQGGVPNAWWIAYPNEVIPAGTYGVVDSEQSTWSQNPESGGCGFSKVEGYQVDKNPIFRERTDTSLGSVEETSTVKKSKTAEYWLKMGQSYTDRGSYIEALDNFEKALQTDPQSAKAWFGKGWALVMLNKSEDAKVSFDKAINIDPNLSQPWWGKGWIAASKGRYEEAIVLVETAIQLDPKRALYWDDKASDLYELGKYEDAVEAYNKALELDPKEASYWYHKGLALGELERYEEAIKTYEMAIELDPQNAKYWFSKGNSLSFLGKADIAITAIDKAIELEPQNALYWYLKGNALTFLEKHDEALKAFDQAVELDPSQALYWSHKSTALEALGRTSEAEIALAKAKDLGYNG